MQKIILASKSPRRSQLLQMAEIDFEVMVAETDETYPADLPVQNVPQYIALEKAYALKAKINANDSIIIAADTIVTINNKIIGKPKNRAHAIEILQELSGHTHQVISGVAILYKEKEFVFAETTHVTFHPINKEQIIHYIDNYHPFDKAGAYAIQEWIGAIGIKSIEGDYYNVVGLPVSKTVQALEKIKIAD